ncbi:hypothetical protein QCA50_005590 [Cerrena zonata]|uniref:Exosome complex exonuclease RRP44 S1 domain-containing protein n=1 Tax=Cerrena zonata TaxID=2478898 RepID=A0AAW0GKP2_9APHY
MISIPHLSPPLSDHISHRLGIEGLVMFKRDTQFDADNYTITVPSSNGDATIAVFDKVTVRIAVERDANTQRGKVKMTLVSPIDSSSL